MDIRAGKETRQWLERITRAHSEQEREEEKGMPIVVLKDDSTKMITAKVMPSKRVDAYAVDSLRKTLEQLGHRRIVLPTILAMKEAVRRESELEIVLEDVPVNDRQANGLVETAVKNVQGQFRVLSGALESRVGRRIDGEHPIRNCNGSGAAISGG